MRKSTLFNKNSHKSNYWPLINQHVVAVQTEVFPNTEEELRKIADTLVKKLNLTVVNKFIHPFSPFGLTLVYVLSQSHLAIHTWPQRQVLHIDLVTCTELDFKTVEKALNLIFDPNSAFFEWM